MTTEAYIFDAVRTPRGRGKKDGSLHSVKPITLLTTVLNALQERNHLDTAQVDDIVMGCVTAVGDQGADIAKTAALAADWDEKVAGVTLNRFCASGLEAVNLAAMKVRSGWEDLVVAGGVAANSYVKEALNKLGTDHHFRLVAPPHHLCTDNAAMIAWAGVERLGLDLIDGLDIPARARWPLDAHAAKARGAGVKA